MGLQLPESRDGSGKSHRRLTLLALFDGRGDADGAFFQRHIDVDGDTAAILALHNALEASELTMADILGLPRRLDPMLQTALSVVGRWRQGEVRP